METYRADMIRTRESAPTFGSIMAVQSITITLFGRQNPYAARLAQTSDHLPMPWAAGDPHLFHGSRVRGRRKRQLDHAGFHGAYLLDLHDVARHRHRFKFNWRRVISEVSSVAHSFLVNGAFCDSARYRFHRIRKVAARTGYQQLTANFSPEIAEEAGYVPAGIYEETRGGNQTRE
jgi:hypothetical protein